MSITQTSSKESNIGLISDEERAALGKVRLEDDVSESSVGTETKTPSLVVEKQVAKFIGPPIPVNRDGMGRYVVPPNGRPLTFNDVPTPGPANYAFDFNFITHKFPVFSLGERPPEPKRSKQKRIPGPNKYNVQGNAVWGKCKKFPMGIKTFTSDVKPSPGPAAYNLQSQKPTGPKYSIGSKDENVIGGLMSKLVFIPDPRNPGPDFCPSSDEWLQKPKSFGIPYEKRRRSKAPGPGRYKVPDTLGGPKWKMGTKTSNVKPVDMPGPANYGFKSTIGEGPKYHIGRVAPENLSKFITPGADMYNRAGFRLDEPGFTLKYRWFDSKPKKSPGPWTYKVKEEVVSTRTPAYTISKKTKPTYPASLYSAVGPDGPGPGDYNLPEVIDLNEKSFGEKHAESGKKGPAPADCQDLDLINVNKRKAPSYSFGGKYVEYVDCDIPGPHSYDVKFSHVVQPEGKTMGLKRSAKSAQTPGPGPCAYNVSASKTKCAHSMGPSVSSRHTPFMFNGVGHRTILRDLPKGVSPAPLLG